MTFYKPDLGTNPDDPFARDANDKLIRRAYWLDMTDQSGSRTIIILFKLKISDRNCSTW